MTSEQINYLRIAISILAILFGLWKYLQNRSIKKLISMEAMELHKNIGFALGAIQGAKDAALNYRSPILEIGRSEGISQSILQESAKLYCNLKNTTLDDIDDLIQNGQILDQYRTIYYSYSSPRRGWIGAIWKNIKSWF